MSNLISDIEACRICAARFGATATRHSPRPVTWFRPGARILIVGQAPGLRVHESGRPFTDRSGDRLRDWMGVDARTFYDQSQIAIVPMAFCFPGYDAKGSDLPPPKVCADTWREAVMQTLKPGLIILAGGYGIKWHLGLGNVTEAVKAWRNYAPQIFPLPHPSWRNNGWIKRNPWIEAELLPELKAAVRHQLAL